MTTDPNERRRLPRRIFFKNFWELFQLHGALSHVKPNAEGLERSSRPCGGWLCVARLS
jgi:hypothetical protein